MQYLTYCTLNLASDCLRAKTPGGGAVPTKENVATENASNQPWEREGKCCRIFYSALAILQALVAIEPSRTKRYPTESTWRQLAHLEPLPHQFAFTAQPNFPCNATSVFPSAFGPPCYHSGRFGSLRRLPSFLLDWARAILAFVFAFSVTHSF